MTDLPERVSRRWILAAAGPLLLGAVAGIIPLGAGHGDGAAVTPAQEEGWDTVFPSPGANALFVPSGNDDLVGLPWKCRSLQAILGSNAPAPGSEDPNNRYYTFDAVEDLHAAPGSQFLAANAVLRYHFQQPGTAPTIPSVPPGPAPPPVDPQEAVNLTGIPDDRTVALSADGWFLARTPSIVSDGEGYDLKFHMLDPGEPAHFCVYGSRSASGPYVFIGSSFVDPDRSDGIYFDLARFYTPATELTPNGHDDGGFLDHILVHTSTDKHPDLDAEFTWRPYSPGAYSPNRLTSVRFSDLSTIFAHKYYGPTAYTRTDWDTIDMYRWTFDDPESYPANPAGQPNEFEADAANGGQIPLHRYLLPNDPADPFRVCLTVTSFGLPGSIPDMSNTRCRDVHVYNIPPTCRIDWSLDPLRALRVNFRDLSKDKDDPRMGYREWDYQYDGTFVADYELNTTDPQNDTAAKRNPKVDYPGTGAYYVALRVTDNTTAPWGTTCTTVIQVVIADEANRPPNLEAVGDIVKPLGAPVEVPVAVTDADGDALAFEVEGLPPWLTWDLSTRTFSGTPPAVGLYGPVRLRVTDGTYAMGDQFHIVVYAYDATGAGNLGGDADEDGVRDLADNCPAIPNTDQEDTDVETPYGDACDPAFDEPTTLPGDDGTPPPATTTGDLCPGLAGNQALDRDGDGVGDACDEDLDGDDVPQSVRGFAPVDNCPSTFNPDQVDADANGVGDACQRAGSGSNGLGSGNTGACPTCTGTIPPAGPPATEALPDTGRMVLLSLAVAAATALVALQTIRWSRGRWPGP